jgi:hypothetical protein
MLTALELTCNNQKHTIQDNEASDLKTSWSTATDTKEYMKVTNNRDAIPATICYSTAKMQQFFKNSTWFLSKINQWRV